MTEPSQISNEVQAWTQIFEQKNTDRIEKMTEEMDNKLEAILRDIETNESPSTVTNLRSDVNEIQDSQPSGSKIDKSIGVRSSDNKNSDCKNEDYPLTASKMKVLKHPAEPLFQTESDVDVTIPSNEESEEDDYHSMVCRIVNI